MGTGLSSDDDSGGNYYSSLTYTFTASGTYYIGVSGYGNTTYNPTARVPAWPAAPATIACR